MSGKGKTLREGLSRHACVLFSLRAESVSLASLTTSPPAQKKMLGKPKISQARLITGISAMGGGEEKGRYGFFRVSSASLVFCLNNILVYCLLCLR